jgi:ADP-heptose:LPS heptosyltransferase
MRRGGPGTHLKGGYLVRNPLLLWYLRVTDRILRSVRRVSRETFTATAAAPPRRILIGIGGHLGDAIVASRVVQLLKVRFPDAEIGIATPSWSRVVFENEPAVRWIHIIDHWRLNRGRASRRAKFTSYRRSWRAARSEIERTHYDVGLDLYPYYPNMAGLFWRAGVPRRIGFATGGRAALYTGVAAWIDDRSHIAEKHLRLTQLAFPGVEGSSATVPRLAPPSEMANRAVAAFLTGHGLDLAEPFVILHAGAGAPVRMWPIDSWRELASRLTRAVPVILTGAGAPEEAAAVTIAAGMDRCINAVGKLDWRQMEALVARAAVVVAGETSIGHLAAAHRTPGVAIYTGITDTREWRPLGSPDVPLTVLSRAVPCAPCYRPDGCATMDCVRGVTVEEVERAIRSILALDDTDRRASV